MKPVPVSETLLAEAAGWMARLHDALHDEASLQDMSRWIACSPAHAQAWMRAERVLGAFGQVPESIRAQALQGLTRPDRRCLAAQLLCLSAAVPVVYLAWRANQADLASGAGQIRQSTLADGTVLTLDTATRVDIRHSVAQRLLSLRAGRIFVATAPDAGVSARPFLIRTPVGMVQAMGTQFSVGLQEGPGAQVNVYEGAVAVRPRDGIDGQIVRAGRQTRFDAATVAPDTALRELAPAWKSGILTADNMRLSDWTRVVARYRPGIMRCASDVADLRVYGSFSLRDTDASLALLVRTLPVRAVMIARHARWHFFPFRTVYRIGGLKPSRD